MKGFILALACLVSASSFAYIPPYSMLLSRTAENHGKGAFSIEDDVSFNSETGTETIHETWYIVDENHMKVTFHGTIAGRETKGAFVYDSHNRAYNDGTSPKTHKVGEDWAEPFFYFRNSKTMRNRLVQMKIAPNDSLKDKPAIATDQPLKYDPESFLQMSRQKGLVTWTVAQNFDGDSPQIWIQQDQFVVTKIRMPSKSVVEADGYSKYENSLYLPKSKTYKWNGKTVTVTTRSVKPINAKRDLLSSSSLTALQMNAGDALKEFYLRFR